MPGSPETPVSIEGGACSQLSEAAGETAWGTAAEATFWVAVEQPGPWGRAALTESGLDSAVGRELERMCAAHGGRALLIRRPAGGLPSPQRTVLLSVGALAGRPLLLEAHVDDPASLLGLPFAHLATAREIAGFTPSAHPALCVCTNGKRDVCCAVRGRPVAAALASARPGQVWESSHLAGHRFAPTGVLLPTGQVLARLDDRRACSALDAAARGELPAESLDAVHHRGLSHLSEPEQAADAWLRAQRGITRWDAWHLISRRLDDDRYLVTLTTTPPPEASAASPGDIIRVLVSGQRGPAQRPASCGAVSELEKRWDVQLAHDADA